MKSRYKSLSLRWEEEEKAGKKAKTPAEGLPGSGEATKRKRRELRGGGGRGGRGCGCEGGKNEIRINGERREGGKEGNKTRKRGKKGGEGGKGR